MVISLKILKPQKSKRNEYLRVRIAKKYYYVHRLVYKLFGLKVEDFDELEVDHIDGDKHNNDIQNLDLVTHVENMIRKNNKDIPF